MDAALEKLRTPTAKKTTSQITIYDLLFSIIFFGAVACLTLLFIVKMA